MSVVAQNHGFLAAAGSTQSLITCMTTKNAATVPTTIRNAFMRSSMV